MSKFAKGDRVKYRGATEGATNEYSVEAVSEDGTHVWLKCVKKGNGLTGLYRYHTGNADHFEKIVPFFEAGSTYERTLMDMDGRPGISIETFRVIKVEKNPDGQRVAFGHIVCSGYSNWVLRREINYTAHEWRKVA